MANIPARSMLLRILTVAIFAILLSASECPIDDNTPGDGNGNGDDTPTATTITAAEGLDQAGLVGTTLPGPLVVQVNDQFANPMSGVTVSFEVSTGGGSVSPTSETTGQDGRASTVWTLGTTSGSQTVAASVTGIGAPADFSATATADVAATLALVSGDGQNGFPNTALINPIVVRVQDQYGNPVQGEAVEFAVVTGGGSITSPGMTDADGEADATWTLGPAVGANSAQASVTGLAGSPIALSATATTLSVTSVAPDPLVEGAAATITGTGFDLTPANNTVTVDGAIATITNVASSTSMTITVPQFDCRPERTVDVVVSVSGVDATASGQALEPMSTPLSLAIGEQEIIQDPADFCLQFSASASGGDEYLIGVGSVAEIPGQVMPFSVSGVAGVSAAPPAILPRASSAAAARPRTFDPDLAALRERQAAKEAEIRAYERSFLDPVRNPNIRYLSGSAMGERPFAAPAMAPADTVGHVRDFRVPGSTCSEFTPITTTARVVGESAIWYTDNDNPTADSLTLADIDNASDLFDNFIFPFDTAFFGPPTDIDANSKVVIVLTKEVNTTGAAGFVYSGDLVSRANCAYSDEGEIFYGYVPDPNGDFGNVYSRQGVVDFLPVLIAHEFTHNIQISRRIVELGGTFPASWIAEGQATFAEEVVGHAHTGNSPGNNYGAAIATSGPPFWYWQGLTKLGYYFGYAGPGSPKVANAPEDCTLFGNFTDNNIGACNTSAFYGSSWSMLRYLTDRYFPADPSGFHKDLISENPGLFGVANVEAVTGMNFDTLFAQWGAMLYADDWVGGVPAELEMPSWDLPDVLSAVSPNAILDPEVRAFGAFSDSRSVRGGSNAYTIVSAAGARPALAIRVRDAADGLLTGTGMTPILWVVRVQ